MVAKKSSVKSFGWSNITLNVPSNKPGESGKVCLLDNVSGSIKAGEIMALMGPSGSGKTTLLNILSHRTALRGSDHTGCIMVDNETTSTSQIRELSSYVEQEDSLIGSLTVKETIAFSAKFANIPKSYRNELIEEIIDSLGLKDQKNLKIGTPLQKGISGGQKRRVSIASQIITKPSILFLDEPTSGLDSVASREVISMIKHIAVTENMIVICSIHQPSAYTFGFFDKVLFLSKGKTVYNGKVKELPDYFKSNGYEIPQFFNPSEYILDLTNTDFAKSQPLDEGFNPFEDPEVIVQDLVMKWKDHCAENHVFESANEKVSLNGNDGSEDAKVSPFTMFKNSLIKEISQTFILLQRLIIKSRRDVLAYHVRIIMYLGLAILMGTVWLRLNDNQNNIQPFINALFFSGAFMSFMSVAYIPSYLEDYSSFRKDRMNGLYGPLAFVSSNFIIGLPFLFAISLLFSIVTYFMCNFYLSSTGFAYYIMWLFFDLLAAESMTILIASIFPNFVVSLALTAFANGLWMAVGGFLVSVSVLNKFWYYSFYWINYQRYVFQGMMFNEFENRNFKCDSNCFCMYDSNLASQCKIAGKAILHNLGYTSNQKGLWIGILFVMIFVFRFGSYLALRFLRK